MKRIPLGEARALAAQHLSFVGLGDKHDCYPARLSGGQQQRVAIARALAMEPGYMLLDEITAALDPELVGEVLQSLRKLRADGMAMVIVTHEMGFAREIADRIACFHGGVLVEAAPPGRLLDNPQDERTARFLGKAQR